MFRINLYIYWEKPSVWTTKVSAYKQIPMEWKVIAGIINSIKINCSLFCRSWKSERVYDYSRILQIQLSKQSPKRLC